MGQQAVCRAGRTKTREDIQIHKGLRMEIIFPTNRAVQPLSITIHQLMGTCPVSPAHGADFGAFPQLNGASRPPPAFPLWAGGRSPQRGEREANSLNQHSEGLGV